MDSKIPDKQIGSYKVCSKIEIGRGALSVVVLGYDKNNTEIAVKIIDKQQLKQFPQEFKQKVQLHIQREIKIQQSLHHHENILRCLDYGETSNSIYLFLEKADTTLLQLMKDFPFDESQVKRIFRQIILGFQFMLNYENQLNYTGVVHLDFKPANVLIKDNIVKISDFGLATPIMDRVESGLFNFTLGQGTPQYMSPEQLKGEPIEDPQKHDIWSAGVVLYELIYQKHPYIVSGQNSPMTPITANKLISDATLQFNQNNYYSKEAIDLLTHMLDLNYKTRFSWNQCSNHIWFDKN